MNKIPTILLLLGLLLLMACNDPKHVTDTLHRAEVLMNEHPDSAWAMLNTLSPDEMGQNSTCALYALLYTQAQDKTYRDETNDSLISVAVDYYRDTDDVRHKFLSYYYKGRVHFNAKDYLSATSCYMESEQLADAVGDDYLVGLLYAELGRIYRLYYDYPKSLEAYQKAAECYERAGKIRHRNYMWLNQSSLLRCMDDYGEAERMLRMTFALAKEGEDKALIKSCLGDLVMLCVEEERMIEARNVYTELLFWVDEDYGSSSFMSKLAKMYASEGNFLQAQKCLEQGWNFATEKTDSVSLYISSSEVYNLQGNGKQAYQELMKGVLMQNKDTRQALQQPVLTAQRDYLSEKLEFEVYKLRMRKFINLLSILFLLLMLCASVYVFVRLFKKHKKESQKAISDLKNEKKKVEDEKGRIVSLLQQLDVDKKKADQMIAILKEDISRKEKESNVKISDLVQKLGQEENTIGELKDELAQKEEARMGMETLVQKLENESKRNAEIVVNLREELKCQELEYRQNFDRLVEMFRMSIVTMGEIMLDFENIKAPNTFVENVIKQWKKNYFVGSKALKNLERLVNEFHNDAMLHFREEVHFRNKEDYQLVCYLFAGVSIKVIAWLVSKSEAGIYQWRFRLRDKIESVDYKYKDLYLNLLSK
jgi:tetratricopeptide (TPR) repeat protein